LVAGVFFLAAAFPAMVALAMYQPVLHDQGYVVSRSAADWQVLLGALCEVIVVISVIGTAVTLFPVVRRQNEGAAIGYVAGRTVEGMLIAVGILSLISIVTLRQSYAGDVAATEAVARALVAIHDWTFLFGPNLALGVNTSLLAYLMYRSGLVPRIIPILGFIGGPLIFLSGTAELFGLYSQTSVWGALTALPVFSWEMSLAVWMIVKGFKPSPVLAGAGAMRAAVA
jgi:hypothetical protein